MAWGKERHAARGVAYPHGLNLQLGGELRGYGAAEIDLRHGTYERNVDVHIPAHGNGLLRGHGKRPVGECIGSLFEAQRPNVLLRLPAHVGPRVGDGVKCVVAFGKLQHHTALR